MIVPPHNTDKELLVLGCAIYDNESALDITAKCSIDDFYSADHKLIFKAIQDQINNGGLDTDLLTLNTHEKLNDKSAFVNVVCNLSSQNSNGKIEEIKEYTKARKILGTALNAIELIKENRASSEIIEGIEKDLFALTENMESDIKRLSDYTDFVSLNYDMFSKTQYKFGISDIDEKIMMHDSFVYIIAGGPGGGKTSLTTNLITNLAWIEKIPTMIFSQEAPGEMLNYRLGHTWGDGEGFKRYRSGINILKDIPLYIDDQAGLTLSNLRSKAMRYIKRHKIKVVALDYLQMMTGKGEDQNSRVASLSKGIAALAKETKTCWIVLSQLTKEGLKRDEPTMADLRESGQIAQDARGIYLLYPGDVENTVWFKCDKQNYGQRFWKRKIYFDGENNLFGNLTETGERELSWHER